MSEWQSITIEELVPHYKQWNLVDIRDESSFDNGHIPGAVHLNNDNLNDYISETDRTTPLVVVCYVGNSSRGAAQVLANAGFETVYSLDGGMNLWQSLQPDAIEYTED